MPALTDGVPSLIADESDLQALITTRRVWSEEALPDRIVERIIPVMVDHAGASHGPLFLSRDGVTQIISPPVNSDVPTLMVDPDADADYDRPDAPQTEEARQGRPVLQSGAPESIVKGAVYFYVARQEFELMPVQVWQTDAKGVLEFVNKYWYWGDLTGMSYEYAAGGGEAERIFDAFCYVQSWRHWHGTVHWPLNCLKLWGRMAVSAIQPRDGIFSFQLPSLGQEGSIAGLN